MDGMFTASRATSSEDVRRSYGLVNVVHPVITWRQWSIVAVRCARLRQDRGGLVMIHDKRRTVSVTFRYAVDPSHLWGARLLRLHDLVMAQLPGGAALAAFVACMAHLASALGCETVALDLPVGEPPALQDESRQDQPALATLRTLEAAGFIQSGTLLRRHEAT